MKQAGKRETLIEESSDSSRRCWRVPSFSIARFEARRPPRQGRARLLSPITNWRRGLSFFLWNTGPDDELFKLAASKELSKPAVLDAQVKRMLADPRAASLVTNFAMKWLGLDGLETIKPDQQIYTGFNDQLKKDLVTEAQTFIHSVLLENRPLVELLTSDQTYLNDRVARHYGITGVTGSQFRWVKLTDKNRLGLLGKGAVLIKTSYPDRTSPVLRGAWVLDKIIGTPPTPPPPGVETDLNQQRRRNAEDGARAFGAAPRQCDLPSMSWRDRSDGAGS